MVHLKHKHLKYGYDDIHWSKKIKLIIEEEQDIERINAMLDFVYEHTKNEELVEDLSKKLFQYY